MGKLSTHVLDTMHGIPARGMRVQLFRVNSQSLEPIADITTNDDGRCDQPLLNQSQIKAGTYELHFHAGDYFSAKGVTLTEPRFLDIVPVRFGIADPSQNYHVPLVVTPWTYSTYRGS